MIALDWLKFDKTLFLFDKAQSLETLSQSSSQSECENMV